MSEQNDFSDELLSAYLDNELSGDEVSRVEAMLRTNPECELTHQELRSLRSGMDELPRFTLPSDFAATVLHEAVERGATVNAPATHLKAEHSARPWIYGAVAIVASLLFVGFLISQGGHDDTVEVKPDDIIEVPPRPSEDALAGGTANGDAIQPLATDQDDPVVPSPEKIAVDPPMSPDANEPPLPTGDPNGTPSLKDIVGVQAAPMQIMLMVEVAISPEGRDNAVIHKLMSEHQITMSEELQLVGGAKRVLLGLPCVNGAQPIENPEVESIEELHPVELLYTVTTGAKADALHDAISRGPNGIVGVHVNLGLRPAELQGNSFIRQQRQLVAAGEAKQFIAKKLAFGAMLFSPMTSRHVFTKLEQTNSDNAEPPSLDAFAGEPCEILFVLHYVP